MMQMEIVSHAAARHGHGMALTAGQHLMGVHSASSDNRIVAGRWGSKPCWGSVLTATDELNRQECHAALSATRVTARFR
jgi:hypothetical protein